LVESRVTRGRRPRSIKTLPWKSIAKFILTFPLVLLVCYMPITAYMAQEGYQDETITSGYWEVVFLEFDASMKGEIYRFIQRFQTGLSDQEEAQLAGLICAESQKYGCDPRLVLALIIVESSFYSKAISSKGAKGLMQLRPHVAQALAHEVGLEWNEETAIYDPEVNIRLGLYYLSQLILQFQDLKVALAAYNFGPTFIRDRLQQGMPLPTRYANKVLAKYHKLSQKILAPEINPL
jgi:soluble lytic murein transglycosylase-like protein